MALFTAPMVPRGFNLSAYSFTFTCTSDEQANVQDQGLPIIERSPAKLPKTPLFGAHDPDAEEQIRHRVRDHA